jgi:guanylate kinase
MLGKLHYANPQYNILVKTTTRDPRDYEIDGVHYHFLSPEDFAIKVLNGDLIEVASFNNWFYGTDIHELKKDTINMGVFSIYGIECMLDDPRLEVYPIYIQASDKTRLLRSLNREQNPNCEEICRRFFADKKDFADIPFDYHVFNNENGSLPAVLSNYIKDLFV